MNYVANRKLKHDNILIVDKWKLVSLLNELLDPFQIVMQQCCKNNSLLTSVIRHAAVLKVFNHKDHSPKVVLQPRQP